MSRRIKPASSRRSSNMLGLVLVGLALAILVGGAALALRPTAPAGAQDRAQATAPAGVQRPADATTPPKAGGNPAPVAVTAEDGAVRLAVADLADGQARFYTYQGAGKPVPFFVLKSSDGVIRAALDACDVCYSARKGYHQEGDVMVCNNCGSRFPSARINDVKGGCNPAPLTREVQGDQLIIKASDLEAGARYF